MNSYCADSNINIRETSIALGGTVTTLAKEYGCERCGANPSSPGCTNTAESGYINPLDRETSNALCATWEQVADAGNRLWQCISIDHHISRNRYYLNEDCQDERTDADYKLLKKQHDHVDTDGDATGNVIHNQRRLARSEMSWGYSWRNMLRFPNLQFTTGGTFKLCFCDSEMRSSECSRVEDYNVEIGRVHVSGVSCLLTDKRFRRYVCVDQYYGGLRCYPGAAPAPVVPTPNMAVSTSKIAQALVAADINTYCLFGPEEQMKADDRCQIVAAWQSSDANR